MPVKQLEIYRYPAYPVPVAFKFRPFIKKFLIFWQISNEPPEFESVFRMRIWLQEAAAYGSNSDADPKHWKISLSSIFFFRGSGRTAPLHVLTLMRLGMSPRRANISCRLPESGTWAGENNSKYCNNKTFPKSKSTRSDRQFGFQVENKYL